jgi:hypothetical protein
MVWLTVNPVFAFSRFLFELLKQKKSFIDIFKGGSWSSGRERCVGVLKVAGSNPSSVSESTFRACFLLTELFFSARESSAPA